MQTRFIVTLPLVFAAQAIHAATCAGMVGLYLTADRPNASLCTQASGYSLTNLYTKPTDAQIAAMCASEACKIVVSKTLSMTPLYCPVSPGYDLRADFLERVSACASQTPIPPPTGENPAPVEETPTPTPATTSPASTPVPTITAAPSPVEPPTTPSPQGDDPISAPTPTVTAAPVLTHSSAEPSATPQSKDDDSIPTPATTRPLCGSN